MKHPPSLMDLPYIRKIGDQYWCQCGWNLDATSPFKLRPKIAAHVREHCPLTSRRRELIDLVRDLLNL